MVPIASPSRRVGIALLVVAIFVVGVAQPTVNALPGVSDDTGPAEMEITEFERLESGCAAAVDDYGSGSWTGGKYSKVAFIRTSAVDANLSARVERTSPAGADLSTFRVHVDSTHDGSTNDTCETGVRYRITLEGTDRPPAGILPDAHGTRILVLQNGAYGGCAASVTSPLDAECDRFRDQPRRTWRNATEGA